MAGHNTIPCQRYDYCDAYKSAQNKVLRTLGTSLLKALTANVMDTSNVTYRGVKRLLLQAPCSHTACYFGMECLRHFQYCSKPSA